MLTETYKFINKGVVGLRYKSNWTYKVSSKTFSELNLTLFFNRRFKTIFKYITLVWAITILKLALLASDLYTCIKLLAFNSWSNDYIKPYLPFRISKWLFSVCILVSIVLSVWEGYNGYWIFKTDNIALTYVNNFSRFLNSLINYNKFCVYNRVTPETKSQKICFFAFFELKNCFKLLFADTPRQIINGLTLWSVLLTVHSNSDLGDFQSFDSLISRIKKIAKTNHPEAVILSFMFFSFVIWIFFITKFFIAIGCAIYAYSNLLQDRKFNTLREKICTTVAENVDRLILEQEKKFCQKEEYTPIYSPLIIGSTHSSSDSIMENESTKKNVENVSDELLYHNVENLQINYENFVDFASPINASSNMYTNYFVPYIRNDSQFCLSSAEGSEEKVVDVNKILYGATFSKNPSTKMEAHQLKPQSLKIDKNVKYRKHILTPDNIYTKGSIFQPSKHKLKL